MTKKNREVRVLGESKLDWRKKRDRARHKKDEVSEFSRARKKPFKSTYVCVCARRPDTCKAHTSNV